jgi:ElaB/YqjD/DUF883 family membrane-anchored ribosome-binding protein
MNDDTREAREAAESAGAEASGRDAGGAAASGDPEALRRDVEHTREELGETVEALSAKADVKGQVQEKVEQRKQAVKEKTGEVRTKVAGAVSGAGGRVSGAATTAGQRVSGATPEDVKQGAAQAASAAATTTQERPLPALGVAFAGGLLLGWLVGRR